MDITELVKGQNIFNMSFAKIKELKLRKWKLCWYWYSYCPVNSYFISNFKI